jgi:hypothetical protein
VNVPKRRVPSVSFTARERADSRHVNVPKRRVPSVIHRCGDPTARITL